MEKQRKNGTWETMPENGAERINAIRRIVDGGGYAKVDGFTIDHFSASAIITVWNALNEANRARFQNLTANKMAKVAFQFVK